MKTLPRVLVLCTGNSCRSQMAEGFLRCRAADVLEAHSAGSRPAGQVHPLAVRVMAEVGVDISRQTSKHLRPFLENPPEVVITVCDDARESCPAFPRGTVRHHWSFPDPARARGGESQVLSRFREIRDTIGMVFTAWVDGLRDGRRFP